MDVLIDPIDLLIKSIHLGSNLISFLLNDGDLLFFLGFDEAAESFVKLLQLANNRRDVPFDLDQIFVVGNCDGIIAFEYPWDFGLEVS